MAATSNEGTLSPLGHKKLNHAHRETRTWCMECESRVSWRWWPPEKNVSPAETVDPRVWSALG